MVAGGGRTHARTRPLIAARTARKQADMEALLCIYLPSSMPPKAANTTEWNSSQAALGKRVVFGLCDRESATRTAAEQTP